MVSVAAVSTSYLLNDNVLLDFQYLINKFLIVCLTIWVWLVNDIDYNVVAVYNITNHGAMNSDMQTFNLVVWQRPAKSGTYSIEMFFVSSYTYCFLKLTLLYIFLIFAGLLTTCLWLGVMRLQMKKESTVPQDFLSAVMCQRMDKHAMPV